MRLSRPFCASALVVLAVVLSAAPHAQTDRFPDLWLAAGRVEGMAVLGDTLFVTGRFGAVGPPTGQLAVLDKTTGQADTSYPRVDAPGTGVLVTLPDGAGGYYAGGEFFNFGEQPRLNLAHVLSDGTIDPGFRPDPSIAGASGFVEALVLDDNVLYVGGRFDTVGGQPREDLAALDAVTGAALPFAADFDRSNDFRSVRALVGDAGVLYVAGEFSAVNGQPRTSLAAFDAVTGALLPWGPTLRVGPPDTAPFILSLALSDATLYFSGGFDTVSGQAREEIAEVTLADAVTGEGGIPTAWVPTFGLSDPVIAQDLLVVGGDVFAAAGRRRLARIDRTTAVVAYMSGGLSNASVLSYDPEGGPSGQGTLYVGGQVLGSDNSTPFPTVVALDAATAQPTGYRVVGASAGSTVRALAVEPGPAGRLFAGGTFVTLSAGVTGRQGLAAFDLTTGRPTAFAATLAGAGQGLFEDLALSPDGRFLYGYSNIVGGAAIALTEFDLVTGGVREFVPQGLTADTYAASAHVRAATGQTAASRGTAPAAAPNSRVENATSALVVTDDGAGAGRVCVVLSGVACYDRASASLIYYTGFATVRAQGGNNGDLVYLPPGGPVAGPGGADGTLYLAYPIEEDPAGTRRPALAALDFATGAVLPSWTPGFAFAGAEGYALSLFDPDGEGPAAAALYAGGDRDWTVQGRRRAGVAAFDPLTAAVGSWAPLVEGGPVFSLAAHLTPAPGGSGAGGVVYAGGAFGFIGGVPRQCCAAAFDATSGAYIDTWQPFAGVTYALLVSERHEALFIGGSFGSTPRGSGHAGVTGVSLARPLLPTSGEAGAPAAPRAASVALAGPNPLRSRTALAVSLPAAQAVEASLYDVLGRRVAVLHEGVLPAGVSRLDVDASDLPAGVYVARVSGEGFTEALTLTVVR